MKSKSNVHKILSSLALLLSDVLKVTPIYEALLERIVEKNGNTIQNEKPGGNGGTKIAQGDYLVVLSSENTYQEIQMNLRNLCHAK